MPKAVKIPGVVLKSLMDEYQLNPAKLAREINLSHTLLWQIINGKIKVTVPVALRLAAFFGTTPKYWLDLQTDYSLELAAHDPELLQIVKGIGKAKKPAPGKPAKPAAKGKADTGPAGKKAPARGRPAAKSAAKAAPKPRKKAEKATVKFE